MAALPLVSRTQAANSDFPSRLIRIVVPFPPGSAGDTVGRILALKMQAALSQPVIVDNKPGAAGNIAADSVVRAPADGYTLLSSTSSIVIAPWLQKMSFDPLKDLMPLSQTVAGSYVLLVNPRFPASSLTEFIATVKRGPGKYSYASYGIGSGPHLAMELLKSRTGLFVVHIPYRGAAQAMQDLVAGQVDMAFDTTFAAIPQIRAGKVRAIALGGPSAYDVLPGIPTIAQTLPGFDTDGWQGLFAPSGTPADVAARLTAEIAHAVQSADVAVRFRELGFQTIGSSSKSFATLIAADFARYGKLVRERGIRDE